MIAGKLEILKYVPQSLLKEDIDAMYMEEFLELLAAARYIQELEVNNLKKAIAEVFAEG